MSDQQQQQPQSLPAAEKAINGTVTGGGTGGTGTGGGTANAENIPSAIATGDGTGQQKSATGDGTGQQKPATGDHPLPPAATAVKDTPPKAVDLSGSGDPTHANVPPDHVPAGSPDVTPLVDSNFPPTPIVPIGPPSPPAVPVAPPADSPTGAAPAVAGGDDKKPSPPSPAAEPSNQNKPAPADVKPFVPSQPGGGADENKPPGGDAKKPKLTGDDENKDPSKPPSSTPLVDTTDGINKKDGEKKGGDDKPEVHYVRPVQDGVFDEESYQVRMYTPDTDKEAQKRAAAAAAAGRTPTEPAGHVTSGQSGAVPSGAVIQPKKPEPAQQQKFVKIGKHEDEEEEEEEEEDEEVVRPAISKTPKLVQVLEKGDEDITKLDKKLEPVEQEVYDDTKPVVEGFLHGYHEILEKRDAAAVKAKAEQATQTESKPVPCIPDLHEPLKNPAAQVGKQLSEIAAKLDSQYRPVVSDMVKEFMDELRKLNGGLQPSLQSVWASFKKIAEEVFRPGFTWSRILILLLFTFEIFVHLYTQHVPKTAQDFLLWFMKLVVNLGLTAWIAKQGGWKAATSGVIKEQPAGTIDQVGKSAETQQVGCQLCEQLRSPQVIAAAGAAALAGMAYYFFRR